MFKYFIFFREQDEFALRSNQLSANAINNGKFKEIVPVHVSTETKKSCVVADNGIRISTIEKLSNLKPAFIKYHGTVTAGLKKINYNIKLKIFIILKKNLYSLSNFF